MGGMDRYGGAMDGLFHPITQTWFEGRFGQPTDPQRMGWPAIARRENTLVAAPTGSGKTLTAFLVCIDELLRESIQGEMPDECRVLYVSPLKALATDIRKNLEQPLEELQAKAREMGYAPSPIRTFTRTGDTPSHQRQAILKKPPHILVTTPESLYLMLTSEKGRGVLRTVRTVIVDEIHALARDKRGSHLTLSLERLKALTDHPPTLIGLSATQKPIEAIAAFLVGADISCAERSAQPCTIIDTGHVRKLDMDLLVPPSPLSTICSHEQWDEIYTLLAEQIREHRSTLIFVNTRRLAERVAYRLSEMLGDEQVLCHHGSLSKARRLNAETLLKEGRLKAIVATASLELGIDIGFIDLVCQVGVPYSIATFLQRIGRSGHAIRATPKGRFVPLTRDELLESFALMRSIRERVLDRIPIPVAPIDILAQQIIAEVAACGPEAAVPVQEVYDLFTRAWPYRHLSMESFRHIIQCASEGYAPGRRKFAYLIWDRIGDKLSTKAGARLAALTAGGAIPEMGEYRVVLEEDDTVLGSVNEDFAIESLKGDIFVLGTHSWRIKRVRGTDLVVEDARGLPPTIPFWVGEAPGRTEEFSTAVSNLREEIAAHLPNAEVGGEAWLEREPREILEQYPQTPFDGAKAWLGEVTGVKNAWPLLQSVHYVAVQKAALGLIPSKTNVVFERFFDEAGGMQLVIHSPYGARINRGWGLALRKRFCRAFDFELQASADDDGIVLSLGAQQSFPIEDLFKMLTADNVEHFLTQALLAAPMFGARWRWNATRALVVLRTVAGKRVAPAILKFRSEDLLTAVFPAQTACQENSPGDIEVPDHPLVRQTVHDCMTEAMDLAGLQKVFADIEAGRVKLLAKDTREPSPFAYQLVSSSPYAFLDDAPAEERRTRAVAMRPALSVLELRDLDRMEPAAVAQVAAEAWPQPRSADEWYETLVATPAFPLERAEEFSHWTQALLAQGRVSVARGQLAGREVGWLVAAESVPLINAAFEGLSWQPGLRLPEFLNQNVPGRAEARQAILHGWLQIRGPVSLDELTALFGLDNPQTYLEATETSGAILRCRLEPGGDYTHWCARGLLRRIHRLTVDGLREQIRPVAPEDYLEYVFEQHGLNLAKRPVFDGEEGLESVVERLQGFEAAAGVWEEELLPSRLQCYHPSLLDRLTAGGKVAFGRLSAKHTPTPGSRAQKLTSVVPLTFALRRDWGWIAASDAGSQSLPERSSNDALQVWAALREGGAQFVDELEARTGLLHAQVEAGLGELASEGLVTCDQFDSFRSILWPAKKEKRRRVLGAPRRPGRPAFSAAAGGRWYGLNKPVVPPENRDEWLEQWASQLLLRYGIVFRNLLERESLAPPWWELVRVYRRWEARGEVRGGRFIAGVAGEQFGLAETHETLLRVRDERARGQRAQSYCVISSADPLNLIGIITKGSKIPSGKGVRILFEAGEMKAVLRGLEVESSQALCQNKLRALRLAGTVRAETLQRYLPLSV